MSQSPEYNRDCQALAGKAAPTAPGVSSRRFLLLFGLQLWLHRQDPCWSCAAGVELVGSHPSGSLRSFAHGWVSPHHIPRVRLQLLGSAQDTQGPGGSASTEQLLVMLGSVQDRVLVGLSPQSSCWGVRRTHRVLVALLPQSSCL